MGTAARQNFSFTAGIGMGLYDEFSRFLLPETDECFVALRIQIQNTKLHSLSVCLEVFF
ncbi:MAG: hypothetical protein LBQ03_00100 [Puniceicoccales bacterium]|nr:hypothetical protein [Puniceicoccales bacterium]